MKCSAVPYDSGRSPKSDNLIPIIDDWAPPEIMNIPTSEGPAVATIGVARPPLSWYPPNTCEPNPPVAASGVAKLPLANAFWTPALAVENKFGLVTFFNFDSGL